MKELVMPKGKYDEERRTEFELLAVYAEASPLGMRSALSNVFMFMSFNGRSPKGGS